MKGEGVDFLIIAFTLSHFTDACNFDMYSHKARWKLIPYAYLLINHYKWVLNTSCLRIRTAKKNSILEQCNNEKC